MKADPVTIILDDDTEYRKRWVSQQVHHLRLAFECNGIDSYKAERNPMCLAIAKLYIMGSYSREEFNRMCEKMLIMNRNLGLEIR
jgi:hypothetical protein